MLAKSSDEKLKQIAAKELDAGEDDRQAASENGDAWYELLGSLKDYPKTQVQLHVHSLYSKAFPVATGLTKAKIEKRLDELDTVLAGRFEHAALWPAWRRCGIGRMTRPKSWAARLRTRITRRFRPMAAFSLVSTTPTSDSAIRTNRLLPAHLFDPIG